VSENKQRLTTAQLTAGAKILATQDLVLAGLLDEFGVPPLWQRRQSLRTLVLVILEQKISIASARAVMQRLDVACPNMTPTTFLAIEPSELRNFGFSGAKVDYCRSVALAMQRGELNLSRLRRLPEADVRDALVSIRGIGPWTAGVYLMMAMGRPDAWASGDRALAVSVYESWNLDDIPSYAELDDMALAWRPWRGVAARLLWHAYLSKRA